MKDIFNTLYNILLRADFYYPMCDMNMWKAREAFEADKAKYFDLLENQSLTFEERDDFKKMWEVRQSYCRASMSGNEHTEKEMYQQYKDLVNKYFGVNK